MTSPNCEPPRLDYCAESRPALSTSAFAGLFICGFVAGWCVDSAIYAWIVQRELRPAEINLRLGSLALVIGFLFILMPLIRGATRSGQILCAVGCGAFGMAPGAILALQ